MPAAVTLISFQPVILIYPKFIVLYTNISDIYFDIGDWRLFCCEIAYGEFERIRENITEQISGIKKDVSGKSTRQSFQPNILY